MKRATSILLLLSFLLSAFAAESGDDLLSRAAANISRSKSLTARFSLSSAEGTATGSILLAGDKFRMISPDMSVWYDGRTQWTYSQAAGECNVTEPTPDELAQINPFAVINAFRRNYNVSVASRTKSAVTLNLAAKSKKAQIKSVRLTLNASTLYPSAITLTDRRGKQVKITVSSVKAGGAVSQNIFKYNPRQYPGVEVIDLR